MKQFNRETGRKGENEAALYLEKLGYEVFLRNFSTRFGEIDLICRDNAEVVFVEVKTKKGRLFGSPEETFTRYKYEKVKRMAQVYLKGKEAACRIDMVAVELGEDDAVTGIRHYKNVVL